MTFNKPYKIIVVMISIIIISIMFYTFYGVPLGYYMDIEGCIVDGSFSGNAAHCYKCFNDFCNYGERHDCSDCDCVMLTPNPQSLNFCLEHNRSCMLNNGSVVKT